MKGMIDYAFELLLDCHFEPRSGEKSFTPGVKISQSLTLLRNDKARTCRNSMFLLKLIPIRLYPLEQHFNAFFQVYFRLPA